MYQIYHCSALGLLRGLPDEHIDCVVTDPPYDSLEKHRSHGTTVRLKRWFPTLSNTEIIDVLNECYRVLAKNSHCYVMCNYEAVFDLRNLIVENTDFTFRKDLVWDKCRIGMGYYYRSQNERIIFLTKGKRPVNNRAISDVLSFSRLPPSQQNYPTEKPIGLLEVLISQSTNVDETVFDPFMGSGSTGVAALKNDRQFLGCDVSAEAFAVSKKRLSHL